MRNVMIRRGFLILLLAAMTVIGCTCLLDCEQDGTELSLPIHSVVITDTVAVGEPIIFTVTCRGVSRCVESPRARVTDTGFDVWVRVFGVWRPDCYDYFWGRDVSVESAFRPHSAGTYRFNFWRYEFESFDTTGVVMP